MTLPSPVTLPASGRIACVIGLMQIMAWSCTYFLLAVMAPPVAQSLVAPLPVIVGGLAWGLLVAGVCAPSVGRMVDRFGGRRVLASSSVLLAFGLLGVAGATNLLTYYVAWTVLGGAMAAGLYDAAFATLGRLFGARARSLIPVVVVLASFSSTLGWPLITQLQAAMGWRCACLVLAGLHVFIGLPTHLLLIPVAGPSISVASPAATTLPLAAVKTRDSPLFLYLATLLTCQAFIVSCLSVHLLEVLRMSGVNADSVLLVAMAIGPAQGLPLALEFLAGHRWHPTWSTRLAMLSSFLAMTCLVVEPARMALLAAILYGAGNGMLTIARGALPLSLFGVAAYGRYLGLLARPMLFAQACGPLLAALVLSASGPTALLSGMWALALLGFAISFLLPVSETRLRLP
ncbi:MFS transporter [Pseudomonas sp. RIT-To-2]|uniref:MFS transporter n=1 Tax=Pseudomonas sp. RIT-To-2 TaxID=3462541 RepID=UPI002413AA78